MERLEKVHREGIDIVTAFTSQMKREEADRSDDTTRTSAGSRGSVIDTVAAVPRAWARLAAGGVYSRAKVVMRPMLARLRHFLLAPLDEELRQTRRQMEELTRFAARVAIPTGDGDVLIRTNVGYVLCSGTDYLVLASLIDGGELERGTRLLIERLVKPGDVFVDVGAHLGLHTLAAGRSMRGNGKIYAIEPFEPSARRLRESVAINGLAGIVEIQQAAASDHQGRQALFLGAVSGHHSLFPVLSPDRSDQTAVEVPLVTLDDVLAGVPSVTLIKIDVEGAELEAVTGARSTIERNPEVCLIVEFGPAHLVRSGASVRDWFERFESLGLAFRMIDAETGRLKERSISDLEAVESANLLFARPDARAWLRAQGG